MSQLFKESDLILHALSPQNRFQINRETSLSWNQLRIVSGSILFITRYSNSNPIIYVGNSGKHTKLLTELFPNLSFHIYNPEYFSEETAQKWSDKNVCFISNILDQKPDDKKIQEQTKWYQLLNPKAALLELVPTNPCLDGLIIFQLYGDQNSNQTYLVPNKNWSNLDIAKYEAQLSFHNRIRGQPMYLNPFTLDMRAINSKYKLDNDYDTMAFVKIISDYVKFHGHEPTSEIVTKYCEHIIDYLGGPSNFRERGETNLSRERWKKSNI